MIKKIEKENNEILDYIGNDYAKCLYLYLDYNKYGILNKNIKFWIQFDCNNNISSIILLYYNGMHVYSKNHNIIYDEIIKLINKEKPSVICGEKYIIKELHEYYNNCEEEYGFIRELKNISEIYNNKDVITNISENDFIGITNLILNNEIGQDYTYDNLLEQIVTRYDEGYGRNYILKDNNVIVSHAGTGAESKNIGILNYVVTDKKYRGKGYAKKITGKVCYDLIKEGKTVYLINYTEESTLLYDKLGFKPIVEIGKLSFKNI